MLPAADAMTQEIAVRSFTGSCACQAEQAPEGQGWFGGVIICMVLALVSFWLGRRRGREEQKSFAEKACQTDAPSKEGLMECTIEVLRARCRVRGLGTSGVKDELAERLVGQRARAEAWATRGCLT